VNCTGIKPFILADINTVFERLFPASNDDFIYILWHFPRCTISTYWHLVLCVLFQANLLNI